MSSTLLEPIARVESPRPVARCLRVALLTNENVPYRLPLYRELARTADWNFKVFTSIDREFDRQWDVAEPLGFATKKSFSISYMRRQRFHAQGECNVPRQVHLPLGTIPDLLRFRPHVAISNEFGLRTALATLTAKLTGHRLVIYNEGTSHTESQIGRKQRMIRRFLNPRADAFICNGRQSREYLESLGAHPQDVFEVGQAIDIESFDTTVTANERSRLREKWNISGICYLYVGHLMQAKGTDRLLDAWQEFCQSRPIDATLVLAGDGPDRATLEARAAAVGLQNIRFLGFVPREELAKVYRAADVFVFPSLKDCFSLAFEEAMAAGLPVIGTCYGGESELVCERENGWIADPLNHGDLVHKLKLAWDSRDQLSHMGKRSAAIVSRMAVDKVAARICRAVDYAIHKPKRARTAQ